MSDIKFEIFYQSKTIIVILKIEENEKNLFNKFIEQLKKELNINENDKITEFKIMTLNTNEMYLIINEDNFENIIKEKTKDGIIKLFLDINYEEKIEKLKIQNEIKKIEEDDDFDETISLNNTDKNKKINKEEKNEEQKNNEINDVKIDIKKDNINIINNDKKENQNNNKIEIIKEENLNKEKNNFELNTNIINESGNKIDINSNNSINNIQENNKDIIHIKSDNINIINNNYLIKTKYLNEVKETPELCSFCNKIIKEDIKYECCICDNFIICPNCEKTHEHPCIKFKKGQTFLYPLKDCYSFMSQKHDFNSLLPLKYIKNIFNITYDIIIQLELDDHIEFGPNKIIEIPFAIKNFSEHPISSDDFIIIVRNYSIVNITYDTKEKFTIAPKSFIKRYLKCSSGNKLGRETINIEIYSSKVKIRNNPLVKEDVEIIISVDEENIEINKKFTFYPKIQLLNKLRKKMLLYIIENHLVEKSVTQVYESLIFNKWDLDATVNQLNNK